MIDTDIDTEAYINDKECSFCKYQIIRPYKKDRKKTFLPIYFIIDENGKIKGICRNCRREIRLPDNFFVKKYFLRFTYKNTIKESKISKVKKELLQNTSK